MTHCTLVPRHDYSRPSKGSLRDNGDDSLEISAGALRKILAQVTEAVVKETRWRESAQQALNQSRTEVKNLHGTLLTIQALCGQVIGGRKATSMSAVDAVKAVVYVARGPIGSPVYAKMAARIREIESELAAKRLTSKALAGATLMLTTDPSIQVVVRHTPAGDGDEGFGSDD